MNIGPVTIPDIFLVTINNSLKKQSCDSFLRDQLQNSGNKLHHSHISA